MKQKSKLVLGIIALVAAIAVTAWYMIQPLQVETVTLQTKDARAFLTEPGYVEMKQDYVLYAEVSARVLQTFFDKNSQVKAGDLLVTLDASSLETDVLRRQALIRSYEAQIAIAIQNDIDAKDEYRAALLRLQEELNSIEGQRKNADARRGEVPSLDERIRLLELSIEQQELQRDFLQSHYADLLILSEIGAVARVELTSAEQEIAVLQNTLASLQEQLRARLADRDKSATDEGKIALSEEADKVYFDALSNSVFAQIAAFEDKLQKDHARGMINYYQALIQGEQAGLAGLDPGKYQIISPVDGIITDFPADRQSQLSPQSPAAVIRPIDEHRELKVITYVSTRDISTLQVGQQVDLIRRLRDGDVMFKGTISDIDSRAEVRLSALGIEERRVKVSITPHPGQNVIHEGYDLDVRFILAEQLNRLMVPSSAVFRSGGQDHVFTIVDNIAMLNPVTIGIKTNNETVIEEGLSAGDIVIRDPNIEGLRVGSKVQAK